MKTKEELINSLILQNNYKSYLEIGVQHGFSIEQIKAPYKIGVDPSPPLRTLEWVHFIPMTSDEFFKANESKFDIALIDGLHHADQVLTDIVNACAVLNHNGRVVVHDLLPDCELHQRVPRESKVWFGDCWKAWYLLLKGNYDLTLTTHDFDCGCGVIELGRNGLDELLCDFSDNLERLKGISYEDHFEEYVGYI